MSEPAANFKRQKNAALTALMGVSVVLGILDSALVAETDVGSNMALVQFLGMAVLLLVGFYWLHFDSRERDIRRPAWLNVGIVMLAIVFVPYYLYKTRTAERRMISISAFFGLILASLVLSSAGAFLMTSLQGGATGT